MQHGTCQVTIHDSRGAHDRGAGTSSHAVAVTMDVTIKGRGRMNMSEIGVYRVRDGKIVREQFFYDVG